MPPIVACQGYVWQQVYDRQGKKKNEHLDEVLQSVREAGIEAYEQEVPDEQVFKELGQALKAHGVKLSSIYIGARLHDGDVEAGIEAAVRQAAWGRGLGARVAVCNPSPIRWGGSEDKSDEQLKRQAEVLERVGERLRREGLTLAYHTHAPEMRCGAREFHHMMLATDPAAVGLCLDTHWVYRGCGNSQVALYDILKMYGSRVKELHLRQSSSGVWSEFLCDGDIDYAPLAEWVKSSGFLGPLVMEQAYEQGTPITMSAVEAHRIGRQWVRRVFGV